MRKIRYSAILLILVMTQICLLFSNALGSSAGRLKIETSPDGAKVFINEEYFGRTPFRTKLYPGTYDIRLEKHKYPPYQAEVTIPYKEKVKLYHNFKRARLHGRLNIQSYPPGAHIYIDDSYLGKTPESIRLMKGQHHVRLVKDDFKPYIQWVDIWPNQVTELSADMTPIERDGTLEIHSEPSRAKVIIDGAFFDKTPLSTKLKPGRYQVEVIKKGYESTSFPVFIEPRRVNVQTVHLERKRPPVLKGKIKIYSYPDNAMVYIDGKPLGRTPIKAKLPQKSYLVEIKKKGYVRFEEHVYVISRDTVYVNANLEKKYDRYRYGKVHIDSVPAGGKVILNGNYYGKTPMTLKLPEGEHHIEVYKRGFDAHRENLVVQPKQEYVVNIYFEEYPPREENGRLKIVCKPVGSKVFIDRIYKGKTPIEFELPRGAYTLEIGHKGYFLFKQEIEVEPGQEQYIKTSLDWAGDGKKYLVIENNDSDEVHGDLNSKP